MYFSFIINPLLYDSPPLALGVVGYFLEQITHDQILSFKIKLFLSLQLDDSLENQAFLGRICFVSAKIFFLHCKSIRNG